MSTSSRGNGTDAPTTPGVVIRARKSERAAFRERLAIYLIGISIGLLIVGMIWQARRASMIRAGEDPNAPMWKQLPSSALPAPAGTAGGGNSPKP